MYPPHPHPHTFHIPVMGLGYTIDSPVKVARFGISSVVSIIEDNLIERMRQYYYGKINEPYLPIHVSEPDYRARRITDYLNLLNQIVNQQVEKLRASAFEAGSELTQYFEMLPETSILKKMYRQMLEIHDRLERKKMEQKLRKEIRAGSIDVNIMTKLDNNRYHSNGEIVEDGSDAVAALRGYANSNLADSSIVFSAGMNPRLFSCMERMEVFSEMRDGAFVKKIVVKVSDYRSANIQGKYLAKRGLWVSEFRVESGLNCGGHAFASDGYMLGPILEEFKNKREVLHEELFDIYCKALTAKGKTPPATRPGIRLTVQGGIGTCDEDVFLRNYYSVDSVGWGSPFLLVPEAISIDGETLQLLAAAKEEDIVLSKNSPLGVPFNFLKGASGEKEKYRRAKEGHPGSPCTSNLLQFNTEFTEKPLCTASAAFIQKKLKQLQASGDSNIQQQIDQVLTKECLCIGLCNSALQANHLEAINKSVTGVTVCPGPNLAYFDKVVSLKDMVGHIYGRTNLLREGYRPHVFIKELEIYLSYLKERLLEMVDASNVKLANYYRSFCHNMHQAVTYYRSIERDIFAGNTDEQTMFGKELSQIEA
ncbi:MAG: DHH family phosphoesterase, partial [Bacteroidales bacterium]|nr:DHH family phosphoesterase [Bacteroidales bacterium]